MKLPRDLSGVEVVDALCRKWDYTKVHQAGSHINLETNRPRHQRIVIPNHKALRIGTLNVILRQVSEQKGVSREEVMATIR